MTNKADKVEPDPLLKEKGLITNEEKHRRELAQINIKNLSNVKPKAAKKVVPKSFVDALNMSIKKNMEIYRLTFDARAFGNLFIELQVKKLLKELGGK